MRCLKADLKEFESFEEKRTRSRDAKALAMALLAEDESLTPEQREACREWSEHRGELRALDAADVGGGGSGLMSAAPAATSIVDAAESLDVSKMKSGKVQEARPVKDEKRKDVQDTSKAKSNKGKSPAGKKKDEPAPAPAPAPENKPAETNKSKKAKKKEAEAAAKAKRE